MTEFDLTQEEVAQKVGKSRPAIANSVRLLNLHPEVQRLLMEGALTMGQARPLLAIEDIEKQFSAAIKIVTQEYSVRDVEEMIRTMLTNPVPDYENMSDEEQEQESLAPKKNLDYAKFGGKEYVDEYEDRLRLALGAKVKIKPGKLKSKIEIEFYSSEDLERILETLSAEVDKSKEITSNKGKFIV